MAESTKIQWTLDGLIKKMEVAEDEVNYRKEKYENADVVVDYVKYLKCTKCSSSFQQTIKTGKEVGVHPLLGVLMCNSCCDYYGDGNFSLGSDGEDKYCRWCGEGGTLFACAKCICGFCDSCIKKHFGEEGLAKVENDDDWVCYLCDPKPLWDLRSICSLAKEASRNKKNSRNTAKKKKKQEIDDSSDESSSDSSEYFETKKRTRRKTRIAKSFSNIHSKSSSSENESSRKKIKKTKTTNRSCDEESSSSGDKHPKKKQKTEKDESGVKDKLKIKTNNLIQNLKGIWVLIKNSASIGVNTSKVRLKSLEKAGSYLSLESLEKECEVLKSVAHALSSALIASRDSIQKITEELNSGNVTDESFFQSQDTILKSFSKKLKEDLEKLANAEAEDLTNYKTALKRKKKQQQRNTDASESEIENSGTDENSKKEEPSENCNKSKSLFTDNSGNEEEKEISNVEVNASAEPKPLLKVKSFARMSTENSLPTNEIEKEVIGESEVENGPNHCDTNEVTILSEDEVQKKDSNPKDEYNADTDDDETDGSKKLKNLKKKEENIESNGNKSDDSKKGKSSNNNSEKSESNDEERENSEKVKNSKKKTIKSSSESSDEETTRKRTRRAKKDKKQAVSDFEKFREKRKKYLKSKEETQTESKFPDEKNNTEKLDNSDSDSSTLTGGGKRAKKKLRKRVIASSDEEDKEDKKMESCKESDSLSEKENNQDDGGSDYSSKVSAKVSSDETSNDEVNKKTKYKRIRKKKRKSSGSESSDKEEEKKKKGRKNIKKILKKDSLVLETKEAVKNEEERVKRVEERHKLLKEIFPEETNKDGTLKQLILDFDTETKEPLVAVHKKLVKKLKPHQVKGVKFMWDNCFESVQKMGEDSGSGCILAHCMGLGKTLQTITLVHTVMSHDIGVNTVLVICPLSTVQNWINEFEAWLSNIHTEPIILYELSKSKKVDARCYHLKNWHEEGGVLVISYNMFRTLTSALLKPKKKRSKTNQIFETALLNPGPDLVICDEGHLLKNEDSALSKCVSMIKTARRIALTGTPLQNNLMEYHCMVQFVKPNILGTKKEFCNRFVNPINNGQFEDSTEHDVKIMKRRSHVLHSMLKGCVQRYDYSVLKPFLPEKYEYVLSLSLTEAQAKAYRHFIQNFSGRAGEEIVKTKAARLFNDYHNLHRIWTHPRVLLMHGEKESQREYDEDSEGSLKDFVVDDDESSGDTVDSDIEEIPVKKRILRSNADDPEVQKMVEEQEKAAEQKWWSEFYKESDFDDLRASNKLVVLFALLKHCEKAKEKVLVFSQSLYSLDLIEYFLKKIDDNSQENVDNELLGGYKDSWVLGIDYFRLDGSTKELDRALWCKHFNKESNTRARLFLVSTRAGGLGINLYGANRVVVFDASWNPSHDLQSIFRVYRFGQKKTCYIYRFLAEATMEEKIYERQVTKLSMAHRVVDEHQIERHYTMMNLQELYNYEPAPIEARKIPKVPKDAVLADILQSHKDIIVQYHEHDSLLENREEEELTEEERKAAWEEYENEKQQRLMPQTMPQMQQMYQMQQMANLLPQGALPQVWGNMSSILTGTLPQLVQNPAAFMQMNPMMNSMFGNSSSLPFQMPLSRFPNPTVFNNK